MILLKKIFSQRKWLNYLGSIISFFGLVYVVYRILGYKEKIEWSGIGVWGLVYIVFFCLLYGCISFFLVVGWQQILHHLDLKIPFLSSAKIYGRSQLAKYIPGTIFQFVGRQLLGNTYNYSNKAMGYSVFWELGLISSTGVYICLCLLPLFVTNVSPFYLLFIPFLIFIAYKILEKILGINIAHASLAYFLFHFASAGIFVGLVILRDTNHLVSIENISIIIGAYIAAWLVGLLTPGAPGGIGIRELVLFSLLGNLMSPTTLYPVIVFSRIITIGGDVLLYLVAILLETRK